MRVNGHSVFYAPLGLGFRLRLRLRVISVSFRVRGSGDQVTLSFRTCIVTTAFIAG